MLRFTKSGFEKYLNLSFLYDKDVYLQSDITTNLGFEAWKVFYEADPDNWEFIRERFSEDNKHSVSKRDPKYVYFPCYIYVKDGRNKNRYIKFLTKKDYKKFFKFIKNIYAKGEDVENQNEILELANIVGEKSREKLENINKEVLENYDNMISLVNKCSSNDHVSVKNDLILTTTSTIDSNNSNNIFIANKVPYKIFTFSSESYVRHDLYGKLVFINEFDSLGYNKIVRGFYKVSEEVFYNGIVYCKIMDKPERWIRLSSIQSKYDMDNNKIS